jgi:hypothetical protein
MLDCVRGGLGDGSGTGSAPGDGTVGVARDGGGISVTDVSSATGAAAATPNAPPAADAGRAAPAGSVVAIAAELGPTVALGAPSGVVMGAGASLADGAPYVVALEVRAGGRILGGGGRMLGVLACALGGEGRMLGGGGRERPRTGGGGGVPGGRERGAPVLLGRGGSETGRGGCTTGLCAATVDATGATDGELADTGAAPAVAARSSLSLALPCSSPILQPLKPRSPA